MLNLVRACSASLALVRSLRNVSLLAKRSVLRAVTPAEGLHAPGRHPVPAAGRASATPRRARTVLTRTRTRTRLLAALRAAAAIAALPGRRSPLTRSRRRGASPATRRAATTRRSCGSAARREPPLLRPLQHDCSSAASQIRTRLLPFARRRRRCVQLVAGRRCMSTWSSSPSSSPSSAPLPASLPCCCSVGFHFAHSLDVGIFVIVLAPPPSISLQRVAAACCVS